MDFYSQKIQQAQQQQQFRSSFDARVESPRVHNRMSFDASAAGSTNNAHRHSGGAADQLRASFDARDLSSRASIDIKDVVRASFQRERSRSSVDGRDNRESPRFTGGVRYKDPPRASVDGSRGLGLGAGDQPIRSSVDSPRLSMRIREAVRAAVEGRLESVRSSFDSKESLRSASSNHRTVREVSTTPRSASTGDTRLLVELRESPRLSRDAPRYSCDGRDVLRSTSAQDNSSNNYPSSISTSRGLHRANRESPRLSVDSRGGPAAVRPSVDERESPRLPRELLHASSRESYTQPLSVRSDSYEGRDRHLQQQSNAEPRKRVPSLVARLMGLEDLPDDVKNTHTPPPSIATSLEVPLETTSFVSQHSTVSQRRPSKESKLLKGLLQYNPRTEDSRSESDSRQAELVGTQDQLKQLHSFGQRHPHAEDVGRREDQHQRQHQFPATWNGIQDTPQRPLKLSPKQLGVETMPHSYKHPQEGRDIGALRQKVAHGMPKQLTEAVLTVLKNSDDTKRMPMSYAEMESRLRQLRLRSSLQEHKTLRQILEAMQSKGLLSGSKSSKDGPGEDRPRQEEVLQQEPESGHHQCSPQQIMLPKLPERGPEDALDPRVRNLQELRRLGSRLHEQVFGTLTEDNVKPPRPPLQAVSSKASRTSDEQQQSIVVMKPIVKPVKKTSKSQNPALIIESMPGSKSPLRSRESKEAGGRTSPWGSPVNRPSRTQPGHGFAKESTGRYMSDEGTPAFKLRRERILARSGGREVQSEATTPRSPKLITLPQSASKSRSSSVIKEAPEGLRHIKVHSSAGTKVGETGRRSSRSSTSKEESTKAATPVSSRSQSGRDSVGLKKPNPALLETDQQQSQKEQKSRRSLSEGKLPFSNEREGINKAVPGDVIVLRNRSKRVTLPEPEARTCTTPTSATKKVVNGGSKPGAGEKTKEKASSVSAPTTPRGSRNGAEHGRKKEEQGGAIVDHVRVTDGDALDQSNVRSPLVGLTNRLQSTEVSDLDRDGQGVKTPRAGILVKKMFANQETNVLAEIIDITSEQTQPSPVSVLDAASFHEEDISPLALSKPVDGMQGHIDDKVGEDRHVQQADTALQDWRHKVYLTQDNSPQNECSQQLLFLRESAKILPPQGEVKPLILHSQAEKVYVRDVLVVSGATMGVKAINPAGGMIDNTVFDYLEEKQGSADYGLAEADHDSENCDGEKEREVMDRRMLFDCVNDALTTVLCPYVNSQPWMQGLQVEPLRKRPTGQVLVQQLWDELRSLPPQKPCDDICDSLYNVLQKDLVLPRNSWTQFNDEIEDIGLEVEKMIFKDLIEEVLFDVSQNGQIKSLLSG